MARPLVVVAVVLMGVSLRADDKPPGVVLHHDGLTAASEGLAKRIAAAATAAMGGPGLAGVCGGMHVRVTATDPQEVQFPIPQLTGGQVPLYLFVRSEPADAVSEFRLRKRENGDVVLIA